MPGSRDYSAILMITTDPDISETNVKAKFTSKGEAYHLAMSRLSSNYWVLFSRTSLKDYIVEGTKLLFYIGGKKTLGGHVIASARVEKIENWNYLKGVVDTEEYSTDLPAQVVRLTDVKVFKEPVGFQEKLPSLSFAPKNLKYWGVVLQGGCVGLSNDDLKILNPQI